MSGRITYNGKAHKCYKKPRKELLPNEINHIRIDYIKDEINANREKIEELKQMFLEAEDRYNDDIKNEDEEEMKMDEEDMIMTMKSIMEITKENNKLKKEMMDKLEEITPIPIFPINVDDDDEIEAEPKIIKIVVDLTKNN